MFLACLVKQGGYMRIKIRLYRFHDTDLYSLYYEIGPRKFSKTVNEMLESYVSGEPFSGSVVLKAIHQPDKYSTAINVTFDSANKNVKDFITGVSPLMRTLVVKNIVRSYLIQCFPSVYCKHAVSDKKIYHISENKTGSYIQKENMPKENTSGYVEDTDKAVSEPDVQIAAQTAAQETPVKAVDQIAETHEEKQVETETENHTEKQSVTAANQANQESTEVISDLKSLFGQLKVE